MKILLLYANSKSIQNNAIQWAPPYGLTCIASVLRREGHEVRLFDPSFCKSIASRVWHYVTDYQPDVIGVSIRNINSDSYPFQSFFGQIMDIIGSIKKAGRGLIVLGGAAFTLYPESLLKAAGVKYGIVGEGEKTFRDFAAHIARGEAPPENMPGLAISQDGGVRVNPPEVLAALEDFPAPAFDLIDYKRYMKKNCGASVQTKRGCAYECAYCDYPTFEGRRYRLIPAGEVVERMARMSAAGINRFFFVDSVFSFPPEHALAVCNEIVRRGLKIAWSAYANPRGASRELAEAMKRSGCARLDVTIDTASEKMLVNLRKGFTVAEIQAFDEIARAAALPAFYEVQLGGPGEDAKTLAETFKVLDSLRAWTGYIGAGFRVSPGTSLERKARDEGMKIEHDPRNPPTYFSKTLPEDFDGRVMEFCAEHPRWRSYLDDKSPVLKAIDFAVEKLGGDPFDYFWIYGRYRRFKHRLFGR